MIGFIRDKMLTIHNSNPIQVNIPGLSFSERELDEAIDGGYVRRVRHPEFPISLYNYTSKAMYEGYWSRVTNMCRGLILDDDTSDVIARPFQKFWDYTGQNLGGGPYEIREKIDGSLGISYTWKKQRFMATRGSFTNPGALLGTALINTDNHRYPFAESTTYLFEICDPDHQIIVKHKEPHLVLIGAKNRSSGFEFSLDSYSGDSRLPTPKKFDMTIDEAVEYAKNYSKLDFEGFVVSFRDGARYKIKTERYKTAHKLIGKLSPKSVWEVLSRDRSLEEWLEDTPQEYQFVASVFRAEFAKKRLEILKDCVQSIIDFPADAQNDRQIAGYVNKQKYPAIVFALLQGRDYDKILWKMVRPNDKEDNTVPTR